MTKKCAAWQDRLFSSFVIHREERSPQEQKRLSFSGWLTLLSYLKLWSFHAAALLPAFHRDRWHSTGSSLRLCTLTAGLASEKAFCKISVCHVWEKNDVEWCVCVWERGRKIKFALDCCTYVSELVIHSGQIPVVVFIYSFCFRIIVTSRLFF